jgi:hypothetical protein
MHYIKEKDKKIVEQAYSITNKYPAFNVQFDYQKLKVVGELQPTSRSGKYIVEIKYQLKQLPKIQVIEPKLVINYNGDKIPHVYLGNKLCLYRPKYNEFTDKNFISETIIPWTSLWLYYYEVWHITGEWLGGGEHPNVK